MQSITKFYLEAFVESNPHVNGKEGHREARTERASCQLVSSVTYSHRLLCTVKKNTKQGPLDHDHREVDANEYLIHSLWPALPISGATAKGH